jgi:hypothetical protein
MLVHYDLLLRCLFSELGMEARVGGFMLDLNCRYKPHGLDYFSNRDTIRGLENDGVDAQLQLALR